MDFDLGHLWTLFLGTVIGILPISNPLACSSTFLAITQGDPEEYRRTQARRACFYVVAILGGFLLGGTFIMQFFKISIPGIRIAGGILVVRISLDMLAGKLMAATDANQAAAAAKRDISFTPLALPMLSGPGSIGVTLGFTSLARNWYDYFAILAGIGVVALIAYQTLVLSSGLSRFIGPIGLSAITKIMGLLLMCMGVQFCVNGITDILRDPVFLQAVRQAWMTP
ncbi:MAG: MarC family NAAT transporter [Puniceicoccales bacterium]|jgi:multiple antibiotic resistance protein|nr:MarC family NAAT transporter [Puniceicoccales bacterium]